MNINPSSAPPNDKKGFQREGRFAFFLFALGLVFLAWGVYRFAVRPQRFSLSDFLGCVVGAVGGFFLLIIADYLLHHARLVLIPWLLGIFLFAVYEPHLSLGLSAALGFILVDQFRS